MESSIFIVPQVSHIVPIPKTAVETTAKHHESHVTCHCAVRGGIKSNALFTGLSDGTVVMFHGTVSESDSADHHHHHHQHRHHHHHRRRHHDVAHNEHHEQSVFENPRILRLTGHRSAITAMAYLTFRTQADNDLPHHTVGSDGSNVDPDGTEATTASTTTATTATTAAAAATDNDTNQHTLDTMRQYAKSLAHTNAHPYISHIMPTESSLAYDEQKVAPNGRYTHIAEHTLDGGAASSNSNDGYSLGRSQSHGVLLTGSTDRTIRVWDTWQSEFAEPCVRIIGGHQGSITCIEPVPNEDMIVSTSNNGELLVHQIQRGAHRGWQSRIKVTRIQRIEIGTWLTAASIYSGSPARLYIGEMSGKIHSYMSRYRRESKLQFELLRPPERTHKLQVSRIICVPKEGFVISIAYDSACKICDWVTGVPVLVIQNSFSTTSRFTDMIWIDHKRQLVLTDDCGFIHIWDVLREVCLVSKHITNAKNEGIVSIQALNEDVSKFSVASKKRVYTFRLFAKNGVSQINAHEESIVSMSVLPAALLRSVKSFRKRNTSSTDDISNSSESVGAIPVEDQCLYEMGGHRDIVLLTGGADFTFRFWDMNKHTCIGIVEEKRDMSQVITDLNELKRGSRRQRHLQRYGRGSDQAGNKNGDSDDESTANSHGQHRPLVPMTASSMREEYERTTRNLCKCSHPVQYRNSRRCLTCGLRRRNMMLEDSDFLSMQAARKIAAPTAAQFSYLSTLLYIPDSPWVVAGHETGLIRVWNINNAQCVLSVLPHSDAITNIAYAKHCIEGRLLFVGSADGTFTKWSIRHTAAHPPKHRKIGGGSGSSRHARTNASGVSSSSASSSSSGATATDNAPRLPPIWFDQRFASCCDGVHDVVSDIAYMKDSARLAVASQGGRLSIRHVKDARTQAEWKFPSSLQPGIKHPLRMHDMLSISKNRSKNKLQHLSQVPTLDMTDVLQQQELSSDLHMPAPLQAAPHILHMEADGMTIVAALDNGLVVVIDILSGLIINVIERSEFSRANAMCLGFGGAIACTCSFDGVVDVIHIESCKIVQRFSHPKSLHSLYLDEKTMCVYTGSSAGDIIRFGLDADTINAALLSPTEPIYAAESFIKSLSSANSDIIKRVQIADPADP
jgi:WD40 repeat protein